jgi:uncharacterized protein (TIGR02186 family)
VRRLLALLLLLPGPAPAEEIVLGLSSDSVAITATFDGDDILIFGAVKRDGPEPAEPLDVVIAVSGPLQPLVVRHAERRAGIWVNTGAVRVGAAPAFYAVASTGPLDEVLSDTEDLRREVSIGRAIRAIGNDVTNREDYLDALIRLREADGRYVLLEGGVSLTEQTLFQADIRLPSNLVEGTYAARILLTRGGEVVDAAVTPIVVEKVGLERWLYTLAQEQGALYGLLSLLIAVAAGWAAQAGFQAIRR